MDTINNFFEKGEFIKYTNKPSSFAIYEGINLDPSLVYTKKLSLALHYDPSRYCQDEEGGGWSTRPVMEYAKDEQPCPKIIDTDKEDYSWKKCTAKEKKECIEKLAEYNLEWDEENMQLIDVKTGNVLHKIYIPKIEYNGETIKPICQDFKDKIKKHIIDSNKPKYTSYSNQNTYPYNQPYYGRHHGCYEDWDY